MTDTSARLDVFARARARKYAVQATYQWLLEGAADEPGDSLTTIATKLAQGKRRVDSDYLSWLAGTIEANHERYRASLSEQLDRDWGSLDPVCQGILLLGCCELLDRWDVPTRVCLNEAISLSKSMGSTDSVYKYVNAVLDKIAHTHRPAAELDSGW